ncbi:Mediator of RNA polymerase II transcription subunit 25 [Frankliniella fusca]|uniref:Mediator of RNA polymerase II transcription subunit 25 n=1 Tax=Frankliniella fusca TaxID=407009 RepID=A0AAE1H8Z1_9NEOP|nr:Mediator of RNA polymerase II transcription subunit 25 [Frankliniella fusca]
MVIAAANQTPVSTSEKRKAERIAAGGSKRRKIEIIDDDSDSPASDVNDPEVPDPTLPGTSNLTAVALALDRGTVPETLFERSSVPPACSTSQHPAKVSEHRPSASPVPPQCLPSASPVPQHLAGQDGPQDPQAPSPCSASPSSRMAPQAGLQDGSPGRAPRRRRRHRAPGRLPRPGSVLQDGSPGRAPRRRRRHRAPGRLPRPGSASTATAPQAGLRVDGDGTVLQDGTPGRAPRRRRRHRAPGRLPRPGLRVDDDQAEPHVDDDASLTDGSQGDDRGSPLATRLRGDQAPRFCPRRAPLRKKDLLVACTLRTALVPTLVKNQRLLLKPCSFIWQPNRPPF